MPEARIPWRAVAGALGVTLTMSACVHIPPSRRAGPRREAYLQRQRELPPAIADAIAKGHVVIGMDREQVKVVLGDPVKSTVFKSPDRLTEVWIYPAVRLHQGQLHADGGSLFRLVLIDGRLAVVEPF